MTLELLSLVERDRLERYLDLLAERLREDLVEDQISPAMVAQPSAELAASLEADGVRVWPAGVSP